MKCLVIGGGGFLGRHLVEQLLASGHTVSVFDLRATFKDDRVKFFSGDLCNKAVCIVLIYIIIIIFSIKSCTKHT